MSPPRPRRSATAKPAKLAIAISAIRLPNQAPATMPPPTITATPISATAMASQVPRRIVSPSSSQPSTAVSSGEALSMSTALATVVCMSEKMKPQKPAPSSAPASTASPPARGFFPGNRRDSATAARPAP